MRCIPVVCAVEGLGGNAAVSALADAVAGRAGAAAAAEPLLTCPLGGTLVGKGHMGAPKDPSFGVVPASALLLLLSAGAAVGGCTAGAAVLEGCPGGTGTVLR